VGIGRAALFLLAGLVATSAGVTVGCGPSYQAVYECDVNFEHCYAVDMGSSPDAMKACWREWLHSYTYGQSRDRVEYAATRFSELSLDPTLPGEDTATRPRRARGMMVAPLPTSAFSPPPNVAADGHGDSPTVTVAGATGPARVVSAAVPVTATTQAPGEQCTGACAERWNGCHKGCADGACSACDRSYKECVPACFREVGQAPRSLR